MRVVQIESSAILRAAFERGREKELLIQFPNGAWYEYGPRPDADPPDDMEVVFLSLLAAEDKGWFFQYHIRMPKFPYRKLQPEEYPHVEL